VECEANECNEADRDLFDGVPLLKRQSFDRKQIDKIPIVCEVMQMSPTTHDSSFAQIPL
jgi:hypothetical protein